MYLTVENGNFLFGLREDGAAAGDVLNTAFVLGEGFFEADLAMLDAGDDGFDTGEGVFEGELRRVGGVGFFGGLGHAGG